MSTYREYEPGPPPESDRYPEPGPYGPVADPPPRACRCGLPACRSGWPQPEAQVRDDGEYGGGAVTRRAWQPPVYDVHPADQAIREAVERRREAGSTGLTPTEAQSPRRLAVAAGGLEIWDVTAGPELDSPRPLDGYPAMELDRDLMIKEGWPRGAAEQMALQHARKQALNEVQADLEAG